MSSTLNVVITDAGIAEVINAQHTGTAPVVLTQIGFGRGIYTPTADQTALHDEIKRVSTIAGGVVGDNIMHIQALDEGEDSYAIYEIGVYTASGTLFAVYSQPMPILHKVANSSIMCVFDFVLSGVEPTDVTVGDTDYTLAPATTTNQGVVELATSPEAIAGTDTERAVTPAAGAAAYMMLTGVQTAAGDKTFSGNVSVNGSLAVGGSIVISSLNNWGITAPAFRAGDGGVTGIAPSPADASSLYEIKVPIGGIVLAYKSTWNDTGYVIGAQITITNTSTAYGANFFGTQPESRRIQPGTYVFLSDACVGTSFGPALLMRIE